MRLTKLATALALTLGLARCASAAPPATCVVSGTVLDGGASPVANTIVRFRTIAPTLVSAAGIATQDLTTKTAADGTWSLTLVQGLNAQVEIPAIGIKSDTVIPTGASCPAAFADLTLYTRGTLTPQTILADHGPSMGGDLTGSSPNPSVVGLRGVPLFADTATDGKVWIYRAANSAFRLESLPVESAVQSVTAGQGITVGGTATDPTVAVTNQGITAGMLATSAAATNVGSLGGDFSGTLPNPQIGTGAIVNADVNAAAAIDWAKISKAGAVASDVGAVAPGGVIAAVNASAETPKISASQLAGGIAQSQVTDLVSDLAAKRNSADAIPQADVTGLVAALAAKEDAANKGAVSGYASLDGTGKVPTAQLPATLLADGDKGDITVSGSGTAWAIDPLSVTFAKMQAIPTDTLVGRATAGTGAPESVTLTAAGRDLLDDTTAANQRTTLGLGTSAVLNVPATGDAAAGEVVKGNDTRLSDSRAPTAHTHAEADVTGLTASLAAKVPTTRSLTTSAPLTGGGTLAGDLTLGISDASGAAKGIIQLAGDLSGTAASPSVASVGGTSAANVASGVALALAATDASTPSTIVKRSAGGSATLDVVGNVTGNVSGTAANVTGTVAIANGGTGQTAATAAFDALAPGSAKGDLILHNGSDNVRLPVGLDGQILTADSATATGVKWAAVAGTGTVTSVATGNGLQGGPITSSGTVDLRLNAAGGLSKILGGGGNELGIAAGGVSDAMLATPKANAARLINTTAPLTGGGDLSADRTLAVSGATTIARGVVRLAGDLAGTADVPTVAAVGGQTAANVAAGAVLANAATSVNTANTIVKRGASGEIAVSAITAGEGQFSGDVYVTGGVEATSVIAYSDMQALRFTGQMRDMGGYVWNVLAFGADPTGAADSVVAINSAIAQMDGPGVLYFPPGNYKFTTLTISTNGVILRGAGRGATTLSTTTLGGTAITLSGDDTGIEDMTVDVIGTAVSPQISVAMSGARAKMLRVSFTDWFRGVYVTGVRNTIEGAILTSAASGAEYGVKTFGVALNTTIDGIVVTATAAAGIRLEEDGPTQSLRNAAVTMSGNSTGLYTTANGSTIEDSSFYGSGTGYAVHVDGGHSTLRNVISAAGVNALRVTHQSTVYANACSFMHPNNSAQTSTGDAVLLDVDGGAFFYDVTVGGGAPAFASVNVANGSAEFRWHGGTIYSLSGVAGHASVGVLMAGDVIDLTDVSAGNGAAFTGAVFSGGALVGAAVASAASITVPSRVVHVTGTTPIDWVDASAGALMSEPIVLIPDGAFTMTTSGNIARALKATVGIPITLVYDDALGKWYPSEALGPLTSDGTTVTVAGPLLARRSIEAVTTTKSPAATESREAYTNEGDADGAAVTLPTAAAGLEYTAIVQAAQLLTINAAAGDTIRIGANVTAAAGYVRSNVVGSRVTLLAINATEWVATSIAGEWTNGTWWFYDTHAEGGIYWATPAATANTTNTPIKCAGTTAAQGTANRVTQATTNRLTYTGAATRQFEVEATVGMSAAAATQAKLHIYANGSPITGSTVTKTIANTDIDVLAVHAIVTLAKDGYVELWCETNDEDDLTVQNGVLLLTSID